MSTWRASEDHERFHIDSGPRINALQVVSEALDIPQQQDEEDSCHDGSQDPTVAHFGGPGPHPPTESAADLTSPPSSATKTIVASDSDVSNGFVKAGRSLPYVFEASESGVRKRSSKILPVCAVCGKRFVCVTTMKRHLVTHTGEKPFSCKVCGKQYTQKGNLRVHERTHRNDRPFECNICHQKFYRKEPMQKHQWRQHGIVHFKSRPPSSNSESENPAQPPSTPAPPQAAPSVPPTPLNIEPPKPLIQLRPAKPTSYTALVDSLRERSRDCSPYRSDPFSAPPAAHQTQIDVPKFNVDPAPVNTVVPNTVVLQSQQEQLEFKHAKTNSTASSPDLSSCSSPNTETSQNQPKPASFFSYSSILNETPNTHLLIVPAPSASSTVTTEQQAPEDIQQASTSSNAPIKLKMKMAYQQQLQDSQAPTEVVQVKNEVQNLDNDLNEMKLGANEMVECQCKTCGNTFSVLDPYNFRCNNCNVKYTSLPTHLIADPLQCIGCCAVFPHKPALKAHQTVSDKERPFRCCKCGYGFRQKAHLQKHQWRIHRRKLEPDPNMKEAEAFFEVIKTTPMPPQQKPANNSTTITMQDIINKSVEKSIGEGPRNLMKTSSKYYSEVLGLEYEPKSSSDDDDSRDQPLDLSPAKKMASPRDANPLLNQPTLPSSLSITPTNSNNDQYPAWKKQKTSNDPPNVATHATLPPISGLQKPMSLVTVKNYKHSSWISSNDANNSSNTSAATITVNHHPHNLSNLTVGQNVVQPKPGDNNFVRSQMELLKSSNTRTV